MLQAAANLRHAAFVSSMTHVRFEDSHAIVEPLIRLINRILGPDDLVGVMTPDIYVEPCSRRTSHEEQADRLAIKRSL
jgi:hypothetical protein